MQSLANLERLGGGGIGKEEVLWENPNPSASFTQTSIPIEAEDGDLIGATFNDCPSVYYAKVKSGAGIVQFQAYYMAGVYPITRIVQVLTNSVFFGNSYTGGTINNVRQIPQKIVKIKA